MSEVKPTIVLKIKSTVVKLFEVDSKFIEFTENFDKVTVSGLKGTMCEVYTKII